MQTIFYLVRHAAHDRLGRVLTGRMPGVRLSESGRAQARRLAGELAADGVAAVYTSPLERAAETADAIAAQVGCPVEILDAANEIDYGTWSGRSFDELSGERAWQDWNTARSLARPPEGESMLEAQSRCVAGLRRLLQRHPGEKVALVSHCDVIRAALAHCLGMSLDHLFRIEISPASVSIVEMSACAVRVLTVNREAVA